MAIAEQPEDWTEPGAHQVRPGVYRIPLPLHDSGLRAVNSYLVDSPSGPVLVDAGWASSRTEKALSQALRPLGYRLDDVREVLVTHCHWDHLTQALVLREAFGSRVRLGRGEQPSIDGFERELGLYPRQVELLRRCGASELAARIDTLPVSDEERSMPHERPDLWMDDGELLALDGRELQVIATPGHTRGHVVLRDAAAGLLFAGDHVLPGITPSLGLEPVPGAKPLRSYLDSLRLVRDLPDALLLPAHGPVTPSVHVRVDELLEHHRVRLQEALDAVAAGAETPYQVALALPWTRRASRLEELDLFSRMLAVLETDAHLDLLADRGILVAGEEDGVLRYSPA